MFRLLSWWKRKRFQYLEQIDTHEEAVVEQPTVDFEQPRMKFDPEEKDDRVTTPTKGPVEPLVTPLALYFNSHPTKSQNSYQYAGTLTDADSFQDSLESMDSVMDSHWDPDDQTSQATARVNNVHGDAFLIEHLNFLSVSTEPRVEVLYGN
mmetsp:Transcript_28166/g.49924  ORF Transcript_28166/g.49924 Transcript_28166/m.49924 type:complete len:151 (-) Transcript_28166:55-507(-)